jgi:hypothetical protein
METWKIKDISEKVYNPTTHIFQSGKTLCLFKFQDKASGSDSGLNYDGVSIIFQKF